MKKCVSTHMCIDSSAMECLYSFEELAEELIFHIFSFVDGKELMQLSRVCRRFYRIIKDERLWVLLCERCPAINSVPSLKKLIEYTDGTRLYSWCGRVLPLPANPWRWLWRAVSIDGKVYSSTLSIGRIASSPLDAQQVYHGEIVEGEECGFGIRYITSPSMLYIGYFRKGEYDGLGIRFLPASIYTGGWKNGLMHGHGIYKWGDGRENYVGEWFENEQHGYGKYTWADGDVYEGMWDAGKRSGLGSFKWGIGPWKGDTYTGGWISNLQWGHGTYKWNDGRMYVGAWENHKRTGYGTYTFPDGHVYEGEFMTSKRHGRGKLSINGTLLYDGEWIEDIPVTEHVREGMCATDQRLLNNRWYGFFLLNMGQQRNYVAQCK